jgi:hypothetical protein
MRPPCAPRPEARGPGLRASTRAAAAASARAAGGAASTVASRAFLRRDHGWAQLRAHERFRPGRAQSARPARCARTKGAPARSLGLAEVAPGARAPAWRAGLGPHRRGRIEPQGLELRTHRGEYPATPAPNSRQEPRAPGLCLASGLAPYHGPHAPPRGPDPHRAHAIPPAGRLQDRAGALRAATELASSRAASSSPLASALQASSRLSCSSIPASTSLPEKSSQAPRGSKRSSRAAAQPARKAAWIGRRLPDARAAEKSSSQRSSARSAPASTCSRWYPY